MADGQGTNWGGMIKGAVKIAAYVTVGIAIAVTASNLAIITGFGTAASAVGGGAAVGAGMAGVPAAVLGAVESGTEAVYSALSNTFGNIGDLFTSNDAAISGLDRADALSPQHTTPEIDPTASREAAEAGGTYTHPDALTAEFSTNIDKLADAVTADPEGAAVSILAEMNGDVTKAIEAYTAAGLPAPTHLIQMQADLGSISSLIDNVKAANSGTELTAAWDALSDKLHDIDGYRHAIEGSNGMAQQALAGLNPETDKIAVDAINNVIEQNNNLLEGNSFNAAIDSSNDMRSAIVAELDIKDPAIELKNVPEKWAAAGAGVVALGAAHHLGRGQGQQEASRAWQDRIIAERAAKAHAAGAAQGA